jgi:hypothetical protein
MITAARRAWTAATNASPKVAHGGQNGGLAIAFVDNHSFVNTNPRHRLVDHKPGATRIVERSPGLRP